MARSILSFGMFSFFAARIAVRKRGLEFGSPPPMRDAIEISRMILVNTRPRFASVAAFLCLMVAHFECPDITIPHFSPGPALALGPSIGCNFAPQRRRTKPPIHGRAKEPTPVRNLSVNRKPLRNCPSLAYPRALGNGLLLAPRGPLSASGPPCPWAAVRPTLTRETPSRRSRGPTLARFCNTPSSALRRGPESRKCARRHAARGNTRNIRRAFRATGNTTYIRSRHRCLCPSARGLGISPENRARHTAGGRVRQAPRQCPRTYWAANRESFQGARGRCHETPGAPR